MNIDQEIKNLQKELDALKEKARQQKEEKIILVPDNIKIESACGSGDCLGIVFGENQVLYCGYDTPFSVVKASPMNFIQCKLIPVDVKDLQEKYTYFRSNYGDLRDRTNLTNYCKYLGDGEYKFIAFNGDIRKWKHWYQVVPV